MDDIPQTLPLKKSGTHSFALPNISKTQSKMPTYRTARANTTRHHSVFLDKIKDLTKDVKYQQLQTQKINQQQKQLKGLLRQFNQQTYNILGRYIDRPVNMRSSGKPRTTSTSMMQVKDKQIQNSTNILEICKRQMQILEKKCENLKYVTVQDFQRKIDSVKTQIQQLKNSNKQILKGNTLRGLSIKKGDAKVTHEVSQLQQQKLVLQKKKQRLSQQMKFIGQEQEKIKQNHTKADQDIKKISEEYNKSAKQDKDMKNQKELTKIYQQKKKQYEQKRQKLNIKNQPKGDILNTTKNFILKLIQQSEQNPLQPNKQKQKAPQNNQNNTASQNIQKQHQNSRKSRKQVKQPNRYQYQYLKLLKQLDQTLRKSKQYEQNVKQVNSKIENSKSQIVKYEQKLQSIRKQDRVTSNSPTNDKNKEQQKQKQKQKEQGGKKWLFF